MTRGRCSRYLDWRTYSDSWTEKGFMMHTFTLMASVFLGTVSEASKTGYKDERGMVLSDIWKTRGGVWAYNVKPDALRTL